MATLQDQKKEILQRGLRDVLENSSIPKRMHLQMVQALKRQIDAYHAELTKVSSSHGQSVQENQAHAQRIEELAQGIENAIAHMETEVERLTTIDHLKGEPGKDAEPVDYESVIEALLPYIPDPKEGKPGAPGKNATLDMEELTSEIVSTIREKKLLEITDIRNSSSFLFGKKRYKFEELMHGSGSSSTSSGKSVATQYLLTALQVSSDVTIDLTQLANWATFDQIIAVYRNNVPQTQGAQYNFTVVGSTLTIFSADASEIFNLTYSFT